jgi:hypothetical protein
MDHAPNQSNSCAALVLSLSFGWLFGRSVVRSFVKCVEIGEAAGESDGWNGSNLAILPVL